MPRDVISGPGTRLAIASFLLMAVDPLQYPIVRTGPFDTGFRLTGYDRPDKDADEVDKHSHALGFLDRIIEEAASRQLQLRDRLDAQAVLWAVRED